MAFDKKIIQKNFSKNSFQYDEYALIQKHCADKLSDLARQFINKNSQILDLGSGTSFVAKNFSNNKLFEVDIAQNMLKHWDNRPNNIHAILADIENLPFKNRQFDIIFSSFSLQWINNFDSLFAQISKILKTDGILAIAIPNDETFIEIKTAAKLVDCYFNLNILPEENSLIFALEKNSFTKIILQNENILQQYQSAFDCLNSIKKIGAGYSYKKNFLAKNKLQEFNHVFATMFDNKTSWHLSYLIYKNGNIF